MAYQGGGYATPADFGDRKLSRLAVDTRKRRHRDRFRVRQLDHPRRRPPNVDLSPREYCARPSLRSVPFHDIGYYTTPLHKPRRPVIASNSLDTEPRQSNAGATPVRLGPRTSDFALHLAARSMRHAKNYSNVVVR